MTGEARMSPWPTMPPRFRWAAGPDRIAHAVAARGPVGASACGLSPAVPMRTAETGVRCPRCLAVLGLAPWPAT